MEVATSLLLPDFIPIPLETIKTLLLWWDKLVIPDPGNRSTEFTDSSIDQFLREIALLLDEKLVEFYSTDIPDQRRRALEETQARAIEAVWEEHAVNENERDAARMTETGARAIFRARATMVADIHLERLRSALSECALKAWAPTEGSFLGTLSSLPAEMISVDHVPSGEAALFSATMSGLTINPDTSVDDVLAFRAKHAAALGRLRASLVDLAGGIRMGPSQEFVANQAEAIVVNRVQPQLADLAMALRASKISFVWKSIIGASGVVLAGPQALPISSAKGARLVTQVLGYAFDREALAREHPLGALHMIRNSGLVSTKMITSPKATAHDALIQMMDAIARAGSYRDDLWAATVSGASRWRPVKDDQQPHRRQRVSLDTYLPDDVRASYGRDPTSSKRW